MALGYHYFENTIEVLVRLINSISYWFIFTYKKQLSYEELKGEVLDNEHLLNFNSKLRAWEKLRREYKAGTKKQKGSALGRVKSDSHQVLMSFWSVLCSRFYLLVFCRKKCRWCQYEHITTCANNNSQIMMSRITQHF